MFSLPSYISQYLPGSQQTEPTLDKVVQAEPARELTVSRLTVHPVKSCRGIDVKESRYNPRGLEHDRHWAVRVAASGAIITAREAPKMVLIVPEIEEERNVLRVNFPEESGLPGFEVRLRTNVEDVEGWERIHATTIFSETLPTTLLCPAASPNPDIPSPSDQFSTYLSKPCDFIQFLPLDYLLSHDAAENDAENGGGQHVVNGRPPRVTTPPVALEEELEYVDYPKIGTAGFADKYPVLLATEESLQDVQSSVTAALSSDPPAHLRNIGPSLNVSAWQNRQIEMARFRPNIVISGAGEAWAEDKWKEVAFYPSEKEISTTLGSENDKSTPVTSRPSRGKMICTSRCGRCQLPNVDPATGEADKAVPYKIIAKYRRIDPTIKYTPCFGVNAVPQRDSGVIKVGDRVEVVKLNDWEVLKVDVRE